MNNTNLKSKMLKGRDVSAAPLMDNYNKSLNTKEELKGRSLLPICEADVPLFLSAMYNKKYTSEKITSSCPQSGRSMIEMLGVLAIIGVLSVGGIAGYSKAMMKYRVNKTIEQITLIAGNVRSFFSPQKSYIDLDSTTDDGRKIIKKAKIFPDEMLTIDAGKIKDIKNAFGGDVWTAGHNKSFFLGFDGISQDACIELASYDWQAAGVTIITVVGQGDWSTRVPVSVDTAVRLCSMEPYSYSSGLEMGFEFDLKECEGCAWLGDFD